MKKERTWAQIPEGEIISECGEKCEKSENITVSSGEKDSPLGKRRAGKTKGLDLCRALEPRINSDKSRINLSSTISWSSQLQTIVALSTTEAEFFAAVSAAQEILWVCNLLAVWV